MKRKWLALTCLAALLAVWPGPAGATAAPGVGPGSWLLDQGRYLAGAHGTLACLSCHPAQTSALTPGATTRHPDPQGAAYLTADARRAYDYASCGQCHRLAVQRFGQGAHAAALAKEKAAGAAPPGQAQAAPAPVCADCHDAHYQKARADRVDLARRQAGVCGACHQTQLDTYLAGFHGQAAVKLGHAKAAGCTDCHGAHNTVSLKDRKAALDACLRCHPTATESFAQFVIHPTPPEKPAEEPGKAQSVALIRAVSLIMIVAVLAMVGFFWGPGLLWFLRDAHTRIRRR